MPCKSSTMRKPSVHIPSCAAAVSISNLRPRKEKEEQEKIGQREREEREREEKRREEKDSPGGDVSLVHVSIEDDGVGPPLLLREVLELLQGGEVVANHLGEPAELGLALVSNAKLDGARARAVVDGLEPKELGF